MPPKKQQKTGTSAAAAPTVAEASPPVPAVEPQADMQGDDDMREGDGDTPPPMPSLPQPATAVAPTAEASPLLPESPADMQKDDGGTSPMLGPQSQPAAAAAEAPSTTTKGQRRLYALARVLEGTGTCVALCIDGEGKLLVASNSKTNLSNGPGELAEMTRKTLGYFSAVAKGDTPGDKAQIIKEVCEQAVKGAVSGVTSKKGGNLVVDKQSRLVNNILFDGDRLRTFQEIQAEVGKYNPLYKRGEGYTTYESAALDAALLAIHDVGRYFTKLEQDLKRTEGLDPDLLKLKEALSNPGKGYIFIPDKTQPGKVFHAEMKILDYLKQKKEIPPTEETYIAISRLCCKHCNAFVKALNQQLSQQGNSVVQERAPEEDRFIVEGAHDTKPTGEWQYPPSFEEDTELKALYGVQLDVIPKPQKGTHVEQRRSLSPSEPGVSDDEGRAEDRLAQPPSGPSAEGRRVQMETMDEWDDTDQSKRSSSRASSPHTEGSYDDGPQDFRSGSQRQREDRMEARRADGGFLTLTPTPTSSQQSKDSSRREESVESGNLSPDATPLRTPSPLREEGRGSTPP
jgi:hypothetical protein